MDKQIYLSNKNFPLQLTFNTFQSMEKKTFSKKDKRITMVQYENRLRKGIFVNRAHIKQSIRVIFETPHLVELGLTAGFRC